MLPRALLAALALLASTFGVSASAEDSYLLVLTWQPGFCADHPASAECKSVTPRLVLHGLWPDWDVNGDGKRDSADGTCVSTDGRQAILAVEQLGSDAWPRLPPVSLSEASRGDLALVMPGVAAGLDRHEWWKHGTCSGLKPDDYFATATLLARQVERGRLAKLLVATAGASIARNRLLDAFAEDFGKGAARALTLDCEKTGAATALIEIRIRLKRAEIAQGLNRDSLAIPDKPARGDCGPSVLVPGVGN